MSSRTTETSIRKRKYFWACPPKLAALFQYLEALYSKYFKTAKNFEKYLTSQIADGRHSDWYDINMTIQISSSTVYIIKVEEKSLGFLPSPSHMQAGRLPHGVLVFATFSFHSFAHACKVMTWWQLICSAITSQQLQQLKFSSNCCRSCSLVHDRTQCALLLDVLTAGWRTFLNQHSNTDSGSQKILSSSGASGKVRLWHYELYQCATTADMSRQNSTE